MYRLCLLLLGITFSFYSCEKRQKDKGQKKELSLILPTPINYSPPSVTFLKNYERPYILNIPKVGSNKFTISIKGKPQVIHLSSPQIHLLDKAGGSAFFKNYNAEQNLAFCDITCGLSDKMGNLWLGTGGAGVNRYDGKSVTNYSTAQGLAGNLIKSILEDRNGNMWFGTNGGGVSRYNGHSFVTYSTSQGLIGNIVRSITEDKKGKLWFGTENGVSMYDPFLKNQTDGKLFTNYTTSQGLVYNSVLSSFEDRARNIWLGTNGGGVSKYDGKSFVNYTTTQGLISNNITGIVEDKNGNIWFAANGKGASKYDGKKFTNYTIDQGLINNNILSIIIDKDGNVWFCIPEGGVSKYDGKSFTNYTKAQGLVNNSISSGIKDQAGNLWFGTGGGGLNKYDATVFTTFSTEQGLVNNKVWAINEDKAGNIWFGTSNGLSKYNEKSFSNIAIEFVTSNVRSAIKDKEGNLWWGTLIGAFKYDGKKLESYTSAQGFSNWGVLSIAEDKNGNFWFGTYGNGATKFDGKSFTHYTTDQGLAGNIVKCIVEDNYGNIWFGTNGGGVSKYDGKSFTNYTITQGLASNSILSGIKDKVGNLWFGTFGGGMSKYDGKSFTNYSTAQGLANDVVYALAEDTIHNMLWCGTNLGLSGLKLNSISSKGGVPEFEIFNNTTGYLIKDVNTSALFVDSKGIIWAGTGDKLTRFDYEKINKNKVAPIVVMQALKVQGEIVTWHNLQANNCKSEIKKIEHNEFKTDKDSLAIINEEICSYGHILNRTQRKMMFEKYGDIKFDSITPFYPLPQNLILPYKHNNITFDFAAIETIRPQLVHYQYFLEGYDEDWLPITSKATATYGNIYEGSYTFKLKAQGPSGMWSTPIIYTFKVLPPWYRSWWMYLSYLFTIFALITLFFRWRTTSLRKEKEVLEQTVKERTAEVVEQKELVEKKNEFIEEKQKEIVDSINYAKRIQYTLLANDELLRKKLKNYFVLFQPKDIVSGDFYWATEVVPDSKFKETSNLKSEINRFYLAVCDSTGHGVPGAFMSLLNISFLNEAITEKNIGQPNEIFNHVRQRLIENVSQDGAQDGMDGILLCFENEKITYAAANNAPILVRNNLVVDLPMDKMPIGKGEKNTSFTLHSIDTQKGDVLYFYTDGYADQFGGPKGKKFKYKQLHELLVSIHQQPMKEQKQLLANAIEKWKGNLEQVDDILIIGLQIS